MNNRENGRNGRSRSRFDEYGQDAPTSRWGREQQRGTWQEQGGQEHPLDFGTHGEYSDPYRDYGFDESGSNRYAPASYNEGPRQPRREEYRGEYGSPRHDRSSSSYEGYGRNEEYGDRQSGSYGSGRWNEGGRESQGYNRGWEDLGARREERYENYRNEPRGSYGTSDWNDFSPRGGNREWNRGSGRNEQNSGPAWQGRYNSNEERYSGRNDFRGYGSEGSSWSTRNDMGNNVGREQGSQGLSRREDRWNDRGMESGYDRPWQEGPYSGRAPKGYSRSDERIQEDVCERLTYNGYVDPSDVQVSVHDGEVTLSGTINDRRSKRLIEDAIDSVRGVRDIRNELRVERNQNREESYRSESNDTGRSRSTSSSSPNASLSSSSSTKSGSTSSTSKSKSSRNSTAG